MYTVSIAASAAVTGNKPPLPQTHIFETLADWHASPVYRERPPPSRTRRPWYVEDEDYVARHYPSAIPVSDIATTLKRSIGAIRAKARALGVRRPRIGEEPSAELPPPPPPPVPAATNLHLLDGSLLQFRCRRNGRRTWDNPGRLLLAACWMRGFAPALTATILGIKKEQVSSQANRIGLFKRDGFVLRESLPEGNPFDQPIVPGIAANNKRKTCSGTGKFFYVLPKLSAYNIYCPEEKLRRKKIGSYGGICG